MLLTGTWQLHSGYSTGESDFSSSTNSSLPLAPQTGTEHREPLSCLWCNVDGFILCQSHSDNQSCQTVLQPYYNPIRAFHSTPPHSPPLLSFALPRFHNTLEVWRKLARVRHLGPSGFMNMDPCFCHIKMLRDWLISRLRQRPGWEGDVSQREK